MKASLDVLSCTDTRTVAILGDMFELGESSERMHHEVGVHAEESGINVLICIGELTAATIRGAKEASEKTGTPMETRLFETKEDFFHEADNLLKKNDTILIKASNAMGFAEIVNRLKN